MGKTALYNIISILFLWILALKNSLHLQKGFAENLLLTWGRQLPQDGLTNSPKYFWFYIFNAILLRYCIFLTTTVMLNGAQS